MEKLYRLLFWLLQGVRKRISNADNARTYSNKVLREYLQHFGGRIVNVSGWLDEDKEGKRYRDYYGSVDSYTVTNIEGENGMPENPLSDTEMLYLDLDKPLPTELYSSFDIVFSHTVLEHVYNTRQALENLANLSKDIVITVMPFSQEVHYTTSYSDYIRLTPFYLERFFKESGFETLFCEANDQPFGPIYLVHIASRYPEKYRHLKDSAKRVFDIDIYPKRAS